MSESSHRVAARTAARMKHLHEVMSEEEWIQLVGGIACATCRHPRSEHQNETPAAGPCAHVSNVDSPGETIACDCRVFMALPEDQPTLDIDREASTPTEEYTRGGPMSGERERLTAALIAEGVTGAYELAMRLLSPGGSVLILMDEHAAAELERAAERMNARAAALRAATR